MPLYEYQCQQCHRRVEKIQKFSDSPLTTCPHCGGTLERTVTAPAVRFKGSGWYKDLYSSAKPLAAGAGSSGEATPAATASGDASSSSPGDAKPTTAPAAASPTAPAATPSSASAGSN